MFLRTLVRASVIWIAICICSDEATRTESKHLLRLDLLTNYDIRSRPVKDFNQPTTVKFGLSLNSLHVDDLKQRMFITSWMVMQWKDAFLEWNPHLYDNITSIRMACEDVWVPDVTLYNSVDGHTSADMDRVPLLVSSNGDVQWFPPFTGEVACDVNVRRWPSDTHTCTFQIGSWAHHSEEIQLETIFANNQSLRMDNYEPNSRWELMDSSETVGHQQIGLINRTQIQFSLTVRRQANAEALCYLQSSFGLIVMVLSSYLLPLHFLMARLLLHLSALTLLVASDMLVLISLPGVGQTTPYIMSYYAGLIILSTFSLVVSVVCSGCLAVAPHHILSRVTCSLKGIFSCLATPPIYIRDYIEASSSAESQPLDPELNDESEITLYDKNSQGSYEALKVLRLVNAVILICLAIIYFSLYLRMRGTILT